LRLHTWPIRILVEIRMTKGRELDLQPNLAGPHRWTRESPHTADLLSVINQKLSFAALPRSRQPPAFSTRSFPREATCQQTDSFFTPFDQPHSTSLVYGIELLLYIYSQDGLFVVFTLKLSSRYVSSEPANISVSGEHSMLLEGKNCDGYRRRIWNRSIFRVCIRSRGSRVAIFDCNAKAAKQRADELISQRCEAMFLRRRCLS